VAGTISYQPVGKLFLPPSAPVDDTREDVRRKLGPATRSGAGDEAGRWPWDRCDSDALCLHVAYEESGAGLRMLTLMAPDVAP
jgi:hypothetical protein